MSKASVNCTQNPIPKIMQKGSGLTVLAGLLTKTHSQALSHHCHDAGAFACCVSALGRYHPSLHNLATRDLRLGAHIDAELGADARSTCAQASSAPSLKPSTDSGLQVAGLQASATTPSRLLDSNSERE